MAVSTCPSCDARIELRNNPKLGQRLKCHFCKTELEVVWLDPVELDWPYDFEDDDEAYIDETDYFEEFEGETEEW